MNIKISLVLQADLFLKSWVISNSFLLTVKGFMPAK